MVGAGECLNVTVLLHMKMSKPSKVSVEIIRESMVMSQTAHINYSLQKTREIARPRRGVNLCAQTLLQGTVFVSVRACLGSVW